MSSLELGRITRRWQIRQSNPNDSVHGAAILAHLKGGEAVTIPDTALECAMHALQEEGLHEAVTVTQTDDKATLNLADVHVEPSDNDDETRAVEMRWKGGYPQELVDWYNDGADGAITWGEDGDFEDCVAVAGKYIDNPEGFCNLRHQDATGAPPGKAPGEGESKDRPGSHEVRQLAIVDYSGRIIPDRPLQDIQTVEITYKDGTSTTFDSFDYQEADINADIPPVTGDDDKVNDAVPVVHELKFALRSSLSNKPHRSAAVAAKHVAPLTAAYKSGSSPQIANALRALYLDSYTAGLKSLTDKNAQVAAAVQNDPTLSNLADGGGDVNDIPASADDVDSGWKTALGLVTLAAAAYVTADNITSYMNQDGTPDVETQAAQMAETEAANGAEVGAQDAAQSAGFSQMQSAPEDDACEICLNAAEQPYDIGGDGPPWHPASCECESDPAGDSSSDDGSSSNDDTDTRGNNRDDIHMEDRMVSAEVIAAIDRSIS